MTASPYWTDPDFIIPVSRCIPSLVKINSDIANAPLFILDLGKSANTYHCACPPGFLSATNLSVFESQLKHLDQIAADEKIASAFLQYRGAAEDEIERSVKALWPSALFKIENRTRVCVHVPEDETKMLQDCRRDTRSRVRQVIDAGYRFTSFYDEQFYNLYQNIAEKNGFSAAYCYRESDIQSMLRSRAITAVSVYNPEGRYAGGAIIGNVDGREYDYILSAYDPVAKNAGRAVLWYSLTAVKKVGGNCVNLGGGIEEEDSLYDFKISFAGHDRVFKTIKIVLDEERYRIACNIRNEHISLEGRFPASC